MRRIATWFYYVATSAIAPTGSSETTISTDNSNANSFFIFMFISSKFIDLCFAVYVKKFCALMIRKNRRIKCVSP